MSELEQQPDQPASEPQEPIRGSLEDLIGFESQRVGAVDAARIDEMETIRDRLGKVQYLTGALATAGAVLVGEADTDTANTVGISLFNLGMGGTAALTVGKGLAAQRLKGLFKVRNRHMDKWIKDQEADETVPQETS